MSHYERTIYVYIFPLGTILIRRKTARVNLLAIYDKRIEPLCLMSIITNMRI